MKPYEDTSKTPQERAKALLGEMSLDEKFAQLQCASAMDELMGKKIEKTYPHGVGQVSCLVVTMMNSSREAADLVNKMQKEIMAQGEHHIPAIFHIETLTGTLMTSAENFPCGIGQASTWDPSLQEKMGEIIGRQSRAAGFSEGLAPVLDVCRDPRFGRQAEGYGEDPTLASAMGTAYVKGLQKNHQMIATSKHFLGFMAGMGGIHAAATPIEERTLREVYAKPFQAAITDGNLRGVMNSYASINGDPVVGSKRILRDLLRKEMKFNGITVSDYSSIGQLSSVHHVCEDMTDAGEKALRAGMDQELPGIEAYNDELRERIRNGSVPEELLDEAVLRILTEKFALGLFEKPFAGDEEELAAAYDHIDHEVRHEMARESMVLLKNDGVLPLTDEAMKGRKVAVIGWHADRVRAFFGGYSAMGMKESSAGVTISMAGIHVDDDALVSRSGNKETYPGSIVIKETQKVEDLARSCYPDTKTVLQALQDIYPDTEFTYEYGYPYAGNDESGFAEALEAAKDADLVICTLGGHYGWNTSSTTGEGIDAMHIGIPVCQEEFLKRLAGLHKKVIGIHFDGRPISSDAADEVCDAILEAWAPAEEGGQAVADLLHGKSVPSGKLPCTIARDAGQIPIYYAHPNGSSYTLSGSIAFDTYVDGPRMPRYAFGHGLSYTTFVYSNMEIADRDVSGSGTLTVTLDVTNTGKYAGCEVVQLYVKDLTASMVRPNQELAGFARVALQPGETKKVRFTVPASQLAFLDEDMKWKVEKGKMQVMAGSASDDIRLTEDWEITEDAFVEGAERGFVSLGEIL